MPISAARLGFWKNPPPVPQDYFVNSGFEEGSSGQPIGWIFLNERVFLNTNYTILGYPIPPDSGIIPTNTDGNLSSGDSTISSNLSYTSTVTTTVVSSGTYAVKLTNYVQGSVGGILYGPVMYSEGRIAARVGDKVSFDWRALASGNSGFQDAYKVFAYLIDSATGKYLVLLDTFAQQYDADSGWQTLEKIIEPGEEGNYHFVFVNGSWDSTFGTIIGADLYLDNIEFIKAS
jgi:hypothetical protein